MKRLLAALLALAAGAAQAAIVVLNLGIVVPTPGGIVSQEFVDGNDGGAVSPSTPTLGQPSADGSDTINVPLLVESTGGTAIVYTLERSSTSDQAGFASISADAFTASPVYADTGRTAATQYWYRAKAINAALRESLYSSVVTATTAAAAADTTPPALTGADGGLAVDPAATTANITWAAATDAVGVTGYNIWRGLGDGAGNPLGSAVLVTSLGNVLSWQDFGLTSSQEYYWRVAAFDAAGNTSASGTRVFATTDASGDPEAETLFFHDFSGEPLGEVLHVANIWRATVDETAAGDCTIQIKSTNPLVTGENRIEFKLTKNGAGSYRCERLEESYFGRPRPGLSAAENLALGVNMTATTPAGTYHGPQEYWVGFRASIDRMDDNVEGSFHQYHTWVWASNNDSPVISLHYNAGKIQFKIKQNEDVTGPDAPNQYTDIFTGAQVVGVAHDYMLRVYWDSRLAAEGSQGIYQLYVDEETTPRVNWTAKMTEPPLERNVPAIKWGWYTPQYKTTGTNGATRTISISHIRVMGEGGSRAAVKPPLPRN